MRHSDDRIGCTDLGIEFNRRMLRIGGRLHDHVSTVRKIRMYLCYQQTSCCGRGVDRKAPAILSAA